MAYYVRDEPEGSEQSNSLLLLERLYILALAFFQSPSDPSINRVIMGLLLEIVNALETAATNSRMEESTTYATALEESDDEVSRPALFHLIRYFETLLL